MAPVATGRRLPTEEARLPIRRPLFTKATLADKPNEHHRMTGRMSPTAAGRMCKPPPERIRHIPGWANYRGPRLSREGHGAEERVNRSQGNQRQGRTASFPRVLQGEHENRPRRTRIAARRPMLESALTSYVEAARLRPIPKTPSHKANAPPLPRSRPRHRRRQEPLPSARQRAPSKSRTCYRTLGCSCGRSSIRGLQVHQLTLRRLRSQGVTCCGRVAVKAGLHRVLSAGRELPWSCSEIGRRGSSPLP